MAQIFPIDFDEKTTMAQDDYILFSDSEDWNKIKKAQYSNLKWEKWDTGTAATITVWSTTTWISWSSASVVNSWTTSAAILDFTIPEWEKGETWDTGASVTSAAFNWNDIDFWLSDWTTVTLQDAKVDLKWDTWDAATISVGTTSTLSPGSSATVTNSWTSWAAVFNFWIPKGEKWDTWDKWDQWDKGDTGDTWTAATISVGTTTTWEPWTDASVTNSGTSSAAVFNFTIPQWAKWDTGDTGATWETWAKINSASFSWDDIVFGLTDSSTVTLTDAVTTLTWPQGEQGIQGEQWPQWETWATGTAATITVWSTTTWASWTSASVTNSGTSSAAVLDFTIPKWDKWDTWATWATWETGNWISSVTSSKSWKITTVTVTETNWTTTEFQISDWADWEGAWDVIWPSSSTDWDIVLFDWTTWKLIKDSWTSVSYFATSAQWSKADTAVQPWDLSAVATSGSYNDLTDTPSLATVATSWAYSDLSWTPSLATVATSWSYNDLSDTPTIPTVNDATLTITQNWTSVWTFTANQSSAATIALTDTTYTAGTGISIESWVISNTQTSAEWWNITWTLSNQTDLNTALTNITDVIPSEATSSNKLADKNYVNDGINSVTAYYITKNANGDQFATYAELSAATTFYSGWVQRIPTRNDYCIVQADENHDNATTRYIYNASWEYQYTVNETALTTAQLAALNSGITAAKVTTYDGYATTKQDTLVSWTNIKTVNGTSVLGSGDIVTPDTTYTAGTGINIDANNEISNTGVTSVNSSTWDVTVQETLVSWTNIKTINWTSVLGSGDLTVSWWTDYSWVTKTISWWEVEIWLRTIVNAPWENFTLTAPASLQDWEEYVIRVINEANYTMTLWTGFTNPFSVDLSLSYYATDQFVFVAINWTLELQPLFNN